MRKAASSQVQSETSTEPDAPKRDRHGFRGTPPPLTFSLAALPDDALLDELEVAAHLRISTNTVASWRQQPAHPLKWLALPNGFVRYMAGSLKQFLRSGKPRKRKPPPAPAVTAERISRDTVPPRRRAPRRPRARAETAALQETVR